MRRGAFVIGLLGIVSSIWASVSFGVDTISSEWVREWYQWGSLQHYLDNHSDVSVYQVETTGEWANPEPLIVSINGNSYRWNKYYLNGFRVDSRTQAGDALYTPDLFVHSMAIDYNRGAMYWTTDSVRANQVRVAGQGGNVGGYSISAKWLQELQEGNSAIKRLEDNRPLNNRKHIVGSGEADVTFAIPAKGANYTQHVFATYGKRRQLRYDYTGIAGTYDADYYRVQLDGQLPIRSNVAFDGLYYIVRAGYRGDAYSEFGYNENEAAHQVRHSFSVYGKKDFGRKGVLTTGLTYALQRDKHRQLDFERNILEVDGEGFEPWYPDGHTHELNWSVDYRYGLTKWLQLHLDSYNSFLYFSPSQTNWTNKTYLLGYNMDKPIELATYQWQSRAFASGMLENTLSLEADYPVLPWMRLKGSLSATLDGIVLRGKSVVTPLYEAKVDVHFEPTKWFRADVIVANYRIPYTYEQIRFLSDDYLHNTNGGANHRMRKGLWQPQYVAVDLPIIFTIKGRHEISILSSFKKYYNTWSVRMAEDGNYEVIQAPKTGKGLWDSPVFVSNVIKYAYNGRKVYVSFSWQSECLSGPSALGNGVQTEDINVLSESLAQQSMSWVATNMGEPDDGIRSLGRLNHDRAYLAR